MTTAEFLAHLQILDVQIWAEGDRLRCNAPEDVLTPDLEEELTRRKLEILTFLRAGADSLDSSRSIVPIQPEGSGLPFFGVPGHNGQRVLLRAARAAPAARSTVLRVPAARPGWPESAPRPSRRSRRPIRCGPEGIPARRTVLDWRVLHGGGLIAFEVARQLVSGGAQVGLLGRIAEVVRLRGPPAQDGARVDRARRPAS